MTAVEALAFVVLGVAVLALFLWATRAMETLSEHIERLAEADPPIPLWPISPAMTDAEASRLAREHVAKAQQKIREATE